MNFCSARKSETTAEQSERCSEKTQRLKPFLPHTRGFVHILFRRKNTEVLSSAPLLHQNVLVWYDVLSISAQHIITQNIQVLWRGVKS